MNITPVITAVIALCVVVITAVVLPLAKAKWGAENVNEFMRWVRIGVRAAEQIYPLVDGDKKKQYVLNFLAAQGYDINETEVDAAIEAAVLELHDALYGSQYGGV